MATIWIAGQGGAVQSAPVASTLATLSLSTTSATAGSAFNATISGKTAGSTITASSSDGTALTVTGTALSGTFAAAGSPTVTLTETLAGATGSPKSTPVSVLVAAALAAPYTVLVVGDSITAGRGSGGGGVGMDGARALSYPTKARDALIALGLPASSESFEEANNTGGTLPTYDPRVALGGWAVAGGTAISGHLMSKSSAPGSPLTFTPGIQVDTFEVYTPRLSYGSIRAAIDGGTATVINETGTDGFIKTVLTTTLGTHTLQVDTDAATLAYLVNAVAYNSSAKEFRILNNGVRTWSTTDWLVADHVWRALPGIAFYGQNDTGIMLGVNDLRTGGPLNSAATFESQLTTIVNKALTVGGCHLIIPTPINPTNEGSFSQAQLATSIQNVATAKGITVFSAPAALLASYGYNDWVTLNSNGLAYDDLHLKAGPYAVVGTAYANFLKARAGL